MNKTDLLISDAEMLRRMYYDEHKSTREIAAYFGISKTPVDVAMARLGYKRRQTRTKGTKPTREFLKQAIFVEHRTLSDIARELKVDNAAISYWAKGYGLTKTKFGLWEQRNAKRGYVPPTKTELENLYSAGYSTTHIGQMFAVSSSTIQELARSYSIELRRSGWNATRYTCTDGHIVMSSYEQRVDDWLSEHNLPHVYEPLTPFYHKSTADFLCADTYIEIFGVTNSPSYEQRKKYKISQYALLNIPLIAINVWDFTKYHNNLWQRKLARLLE